MAVSDSFTLPAEPGTGDLEYVPLGGDGLHDPFAMYLVRSFAITGDVSGGSQKLSIVFDDRFCSMVAYASFLKATAIDPAGFRWTLVGDRVPLQAKQLERALTPSTVAGATITDTWLPPAFINAGAGAVPTLAISTTNEDGVALQMNAAIYLFNIDARQKTPMPRLVASRGGV